MRLVPFQSILAIILVAAAAPRVCRTAHAAPPATQDSPSTAPSVAPTDDQLRIAGFDNANEVREFLQNLQHAEARDDREAMVALVRFPFASYSHGEARKRYESKEALLADFDSVLTAQVRAQIRAARFETLFFNYQGAMIGNGEVWFNKDRNIAIKAVNP